MCTENDHQSNSRPVTPSEEDCCHSECNPCIFDIHKKLIQEYEKKKKQNIKIQNERNILCSYAYKNFIVTDIKEISECYIILFLKYQEDNFKSNKKILIIPGQHVMLHLYDITKPLTPISFTDNTIQFLIKVYPNGKFSTYLKNIKIGNIIHVRGPYGNFKYKTNSFQSVIMFSMGSGIAAVYPIAKSIIDNELEETRVHLIGGFQNMSQIPLKRELQILSDYWNFKCTLHISQLQDICDLHGINIKSGRLNKKSVSETLNGKMTSTTLILICGTDQFNSTVEQWMRSISYTHIHIFR